MNNVSKSWIVANIEMLFLAAFALCTLLVWLLGAGEDNFFLLVFGGSTFFSFAIAGVEKGGTGTGIVTLIFAAGSLLLTGFYKKIIIMYSNVWPIVYYILTIIFLVIAITVGLRAGRYARDNFYDVVSLRWLYRHSNVEVFEDSWKYGMNRFSVVAGNICFAGVCVLMAISPKAIERRNAAMEAEKSQKATTAQTTAAESTTLDDSTATFPVK